MEEKKSTVETRSGMVSIVGRPNVGKSTLLNKIVGEKITIVSKVPQTTRTQIRGIYTDERGQIVFIDTPGLLKGRDRLDKLLNEASESTFDNVDAVIHLVDSSEPIGLEEERIVRQLAKVRSPVIMGLNKVDLKGQFIPQYIALWEKVLGKPVQETNRPILVPVSGKRGTNVEELLKVVFELLPKGEMLYPEDAVTDTPQKLAMADIIREKLLAVMREEVPHSIAVVIERTEPRKNKLFFIQALILVERETQKEIVIGKKGGVLKIAGTQARKDLEELLGMRVFLEMHVKCDKDWRDNPERLRELGYELGAD